MTVKILVPVSGGKDSQACLKLAAESNPHNEIRGLFCDTQFEHPSTYEHIDKLRTLYGPIQIDTVSGGSVLEKSIKYGRFPGGGARHCTDELKIRETRIYCKALAEYQQSGFEVWYGMRLGESSQRAKRYKGKVCHELYAPHEVISKYPKYLEKMGVMFKLPVLEWSGKEVLDYLNGLHHHLYDEGFDRVGCFPCMAAGDATKERAFAYDDFGKQQFRKIKIVSKQIGKNIFTSKGGMARNYEFPPCAVCSI